MKKIIHKMKNKLFDVGSSGILVYKDPLIGELENRSLQLSVQLNRGSLQLELWHRGCVLSSFDLATGVSQACRQSFGAYFSTLEYLMRPTDERLEAA
jgi:hypothetical protein